MATATELGLYRTSDMALASILKYAGFEAQEVVWADSTCYWYFRETEGLLKEVDKFAAGDALVEPKRYNQIFGKTKREFYDSDPDNHNRR